MPWCTPSTGGWAVTSRAEYMREYRRRKQRENGAKLYEGRLSGGTPDMEFPRCYWREDRSQPLRTVSDPYPDGTHIVRPNPRQHIYAG